MKFTISLAVDNIWVQLWNEILQKDFAFYTSLNQEGWPSFAIKVLLPFPKPAFSQKSKNRISAKKVQKAFQRNSGNFDILVLSRGSVSWILLPSLYKRKDNTLSKFWQRTQQYWEHINFWELANIENTLTFKNSPILRYPLGSMYSNIRNTLRHCSPNVS